MRLLQAGVAPGLARVGRLVDAVARDEGVADVGFAGTDIDRLRIRGRDGQGPDAVGSVQLAIRDVRPRETVVGRAPDSAVDTAEVEREWSSRDGIHGHGASADSWTDVAPMQRSHDGLRGRRRDLAPAGSAAVAKHAAIKAKLLGASGGLPACCGRFARLSLAFILGLSARSFAENPAPKNWKNWWSCRGTAPRVQDDLTGAFSRLSFGFVLIERTPQSAAYRSLQILVSRTCVGSRARASPNL